MANESRNHSRAAMTDAFLMDVAMGAYYLAGPLYALKLGASPIQLGWLGAGCGLAYMITAALAGHVIGGISGRLRAIIGALLFALAAASAPFIKSFLPFLAVYSLGSAGMAVFWTGLEAVLIHPEIGIMESSRKFNVAWSAGFIFGPLVSGILAEKTLNGAFGAVAAICVFCALFSFMIPAAAGQAHHSIKKEEWETASAPTSSAFLKLAFMANFFYWILNGMIRYIFPKIGIDAGFSAMGVSAMLSLWALSQAIGFHVLGKWHGWPYNKFWLFGAQAAAVVVLLCLGAWQSRLMHIAAFSLIGALGGIPYTSSLIYSLADRQNHTVNVGYHEALIYAGSFVGALLGGWSLGRWPGRGPYLACAVVMALGILIQAAVIQLLLSRIKNKNNAPPN